MRPGTHGDLQRLLFGGDGLRRDLWGTEGDSAIAPVPVSSEVDTALVRRLAAGSRNTGARTVLIGKPDVSSADEELAVVPAEHDALLGRLAGLPAPLLAVPSALDGAIVFEQAGYALIAGVPNFLAGAVPEGVDGARARFLRYSRKVAGRWPAVSEVAAQLPPREHSWGSPADVVPESNTARQLHLMRLLTSGEMDPSRFAREWLDSRRRASASGERVRKPLASVLDAVFSCLDDYSIDPQFAEPGDLTDEELVARVQDLVRQLDGLPGPS